MVLNLHQIRVDKRNIFPLFGAVSNQKDASDILFIHIFLRHFELIRTKPFVSIIILSSIMVLPNRARNIKN